MKQKQYKTPTVNIVEIKIQSLLGSESLGVNNNKTVTSDESVFSRSGNSNWDDSE